MAPPLELPWVLKSMELPLAKLSEPWSDLQLVRKSVQWGLMSDTQMLQPRWESTSERVSDSPSAHSLV